MKIYLYLFLLCSYFTSYSQQVFDEDEKKEITKDIEELNILIIQEPSAENYYFRAYRYYETKEYLEAISDYDKALSIDPNDAKIYFSRGISNMKLKRFKNAIEDFTKNISLNGNLKKSYINRAYSK